MKTEPAAHATASELEQLAREAADKVFEDNYGYVRNHDTWRMSKDLPLTKEHLENLFLAFGQKVQELNDTHTTILDEYVEKECQPIIQGLHRLYALRDPTCQRQAEIAYETALAHWKEKNK